MKYKLQDAQVTAKWHNRWLLLFVLFFLTTCLFAGLFGGYYSAWISLKRCPLTYDSKGVISESKMQEWASAASWSITTPKWDNDRRACVCDEDPNPLTQGTKKTPVWIAPLDLYNLFPLATYPKDFPKDAQSPKDHVKVCLERPHLDNLWNGLNATGQASGITHCHNPQPFEIFTGWDGDLYCTTQTSQKCPMAVAPSASCSLININGQYDCNHYKGYFRNQEGGGSYHKCIFRDSKCIDGPGCN